MIYGNDVFISFDFRNHVYREQNNRDVHLNELKRNLSSM